MVIPRHLQIETVNGICTARCTMCTIREWDRRPNMMSDDIFERILTKFEIIQEKLQYITLHGCGEPLLDLTLPNKIRIAKEMGFIGIGFATNCTELSEQKGSDLLKAGLDTIICSIDGITKETHESIRVQTNFEKVVLNVLNFIRMRNESKIKTKVIIRFIEQSKNKDEWPMFLEFWGKKIDKHCGDKVLKFDIHNWEGKVKEYLSMDSSRKINSRKEICQDVYERIIVYSNGEVGFCCADDNGFFKLGNVLNEDPLQIYNNDIYNGYRQLMEDGKILDLDHCRDCTIPRSRKFKIEY